MGYASLGIPLTLVYLSSAGGLLSRCARGVFTRALCCCLCLNCGYCCYDERRMQVSSRGWHAPSKILHPLSDKKLNHKLPVTLFFPSSIPDIRDEKRICRITSRLVDSALPSAGRTCPARSIRINGCPSIDWLLLERYSNKIGSVFVASHSIQECKRSAFAQNCRGTTEWNRNTRV